MKNDTNTSAPPLIYSQPSLNNNEQSSPQPLSDKKKNDRLHGGHFLKRVYQHHKAKLEKLDTSKISLQPDHIQLLAQQIRQHVQLLAQGYLQLYGHSEWWRLASKPKDLLVNNK